MEIHTFNSQRSLFKRCQKSQRFLDCSGNSRVHTKKVMQHHATLRRVLRERFIEGALKDVLSQTPTPVACTQKSQSRESRDFGALSPQTSKKSLCHLLQSNTNGHSHVFWACTHEYCKEGGSDGAEKIWHISSHILGL